jgi:ubiquinone/menaquinone biosynthesis C-methylase UbiE
MSENTSRPWHDYSASVFSTYDSVRQPNGLKEILQILSQTDTPLGQQRILDGGFGTGSYIAHFKRYVMEVCGVETSEEGFQRTLRRTAGAANVRLHRGSVLKLPFPDESFHAYTVNQMLHHLDQDSAYPNLDVFLGESHRVLRPGGVLTLNTCTHEQLEPRSGVYWHYRYLDEHAIRTLQARYVPIEELVSRLARHGYHGIERTTTSGRIYREQYYEDPSLALRAEFRNGDSVYSLLSETEIDSANERIREAITDGSIHEEMRRAGARRAEVGESVIISARNPQVPTSRSRVESRSETQQEET